MTTANKSVIQAGTSPLPVLFRKDAIVLGASLAGIAAALELARAGKQVIVIEARTYPGREITATHRYWLRSGEGTAAGHSLLAGCLEAGGTASAGAGEIPLHPDKLKRYMEDVLFQAGIELLYASLPVHVTQAEDAVQGIVIANKSGMQIVAGEWIVDATDTGVTAVMRGLESGEAPGSEALFTRVLEFDGAKAWGAGEGPVTRSVPESLGVAGNRVLLRGGARGDGHVLAEFRMRLPAANSLSESGVREKEARHRSIALASHLLGAEPLLAGAYFAAASHELCGPYPAQEECDISSVPGDWLPEKVQGIWMASPAWRPLTQPWWLDPAASAEAGAKVGQAMLEDAAQSIGSAARCGAGEAEERSTDGEITASTNASASCTGLLLRTLDSPQRGGVFKRCRASFSIPAGERVDVLVAGGGTSGATAGITAAREGMRTLVLEFNSDLGGTGTLGGVDSYWFGRRVGFAARLTSLVDNVHELLHYSGHKWNIEGKMYALLKEMEQAGSEVWFNTILFGALMDGVRVGGAVVATRWGPRAVRSEVLLDATGDGDAAVFAGARFVYGSERDHTVMWYSLAQFEKPGRTRNNFTSMVDMSNIRDYTRAIIVGRRRGSEPYEHGVYVATRESRHVQGDCVMKLTDQMLGRLWPDVINIHFSNHDIKGVSGADWVNVGCIPPNLEIEIPYRMLLPKGLEGILVIGKAVSATHDALPAIRMQADLENLGGAAALAAAHSIREGVPPRHVNIGALQRSLVKAGLLPEGIDTRRLAPRLYSDEELRELVKSLDSLPEDRPLYYYGNMRMNEIFTERIPFVEICSVGLRIVPFLTEALPAASGRRRILIAQALAMLESKEGVPDLIEEIKRLICEAGDGLPSRRDDFMYVQLPPDHGAMPDGAYLLYSLALAADERSLDAWRLVVDRLQADEADFRERLQGTFYYVHAVCSGIERLADPRALPLLRALHAVPSLSGLVSREGAESDYFLERRAMLELAIGRAMARCGSREGYDILISYLEDGRALLAESAHEELLRLNEGGEDFGLSLRKWSGWLGGRNNRLQPMPLKARLDMEPNSEQLLRRIL